MANFYIERLKPHIEKNEDPIYKCPLGDCFYYTINGKNRYNRHLKIYHKFERKEYNLESDQFEIYILNIILHNKIKIHTNLKTISKEFLSPRGINRLE